MADKPPYTTADRRYVPTRSDAPGEAPALQIGEVGTNEVDGTCYVMRANGNVAKLPTAKGFSSIEVLPQSQYDALIAATATISTVLYVVTEDPE
jgi:hypothetical protein